MKALLVTVSDEVRHLFTFHLKPLGVEFVQYRNPLKAMDNLEEIDPDIVLFSAHDFPRHWKPMLALLRETKKKEETIFILLKGNDFSFEEAAKATHLGANGIIRDKPETKREFARLEELINRYKPIDDGRNAPRYVPDEIDRLEFIFTHPSTMQLIPGNLFDISSTGASFRAQNPEHVGDIQVGTRLSFCSLRVGEKIISLSCTVKRNGTTLGLLFDEFSSENRELLKEYLENRPARELERMSKA